MTGLKLTCFFRLCGVETDPVLLPEVWDFFRHDLSTDVLGVAIGVVAPVVDLEGGVSGEEAIAAITVTFFITRPLYVFVSFV